MKERVLLKEYEENGMRVLIDYDGETATIAADGGRLCLGLDRLDMAAELLLGISVSEGLR